MYYNSLQNKLDIFMISAIDHFIDAIDDRALDSTAGTDFIFTFPLNDVALTTNPYIIVSNGNATSSVQILVSSNFEDFNGIEMIVSPMSVQKVCKLEMQIY